MKGRVLLLIPTTSYRAADFLSAAGRMDVEVVVGTDRRQALEEAVPGRTLTLDLHRTDAAVEQVLLFAEKHPLQAVVGVDDETVVIAATAAQRLGLPHNPPAAARASRDKHLTRKLLDDAGLRTPWYEILPLDEPVAAAAARVAYPCVLKPLFLGGGRGVIRADDPDTFVAAYRTIARILEQPETKRRGGDLAGRVLVEGYVEGRELALEGLLRSGVLEVLALFDKPDPLEGPTFEETIYVTPSRLPRVTQQAMIEETGLACAALGLREGPVHAELRLADGRPTVLEVAARSIGGLCSRTLRFGAGVSLEELILRHALGLDELTPPRDEAAAGVMMIPIPHAGTLKKVRGIDRARAVPGIEEVTISLHAGARVEPLPEGHRYLGFIFARGEEPAGVETALRSAHGRLKLEIE